MESIKKPKGNWFRNLIFETVETEEPEHQPVALAPAQPVSAPPQVPAPEIPAQTYSANPEIEAAVFAALEIQKQSGQDYLDFVKAIRALGSLQLSEAQKYNSVFATFSVTAGVSKELLLHSGQRYLGLLDQEEQRFGQEAEQKLQQYVQNPAEQIAEIRKVMEQKEAAILALQQELRTHQEEVFALQAKQADDEMKIKQTRNDFSLTLNAMREHFKTTLRQIETLIA